MIQPISIEMTHTQIKLDSTSMVYEDKHDTEYSVEACTISSGPFKGDVIAYVRYITTPLDFDDDMRWQVIRRYKEGRGAAGARTRHAGRYRSLDSALHKVMAQAYEHVAHYSDITQR